MKIGIDIREIKYNQITGIGRFLKLFLDNLPEESKKDKYLLADRETNTALYENAFRIIKAEAPFNFWYDQVVIPIAINKYGLEIFFSPYYKMPFLAKGRKIITIHDLHFLKGIVRKGLDRFKPFITYLKQAVASSDKIITVSEFSKQEIVRQFRIRESKVKVVYNGVDKNFRVVQNKEDDRFKIKYGINYKYILYVGNMMPHKNLQGLIRAYDLFKDKTGYKVVIIAKKDRNFSLLDKMIKSLKLDNNIIFFDFVPDEDLVLFYNCAEVFVFPSFYEGFGLPPLEAMACGAPVISSSTTSLPEILGDAALYFNPDNIAEIAQRISAVLSDTKLKQNLKDKGQVQAKKYAPGVFSSALLKEIKGS